MSLPTIDNNTSRNSSIPRPKKLLYLLVSLIGIIVAAHVIDLLFTYPDKEMHRIVNLDYEANIPSWFSSAQYLCTSLIFFVLSLIDSKRLPANLLKLAALVFLFFSLDEAAQVHETFNGFLKKLVPDIGYRWKKVVWIGVYLLMGIGLLVINYASIKRFRENFPVQFNTCALGVFLLFLGAGVTEFLRKLFSVYLGAKGLFQAQVVIEESLEMLGASLILYGAICVLAEYDFFVKRNE